MALAALPGAPVVPIGPGFGILDTFPDGSVVTMDAVNEAIIHIGHMITSDGGSHTIDTTGSSSIGWRTGGVTFADPATTLKVGLAAVDTAAGPPGRAVNAANVITFDVSKSLIGGGGGVTNAWLTHVPDTGSKTVANGDLVALCMQMTAKGGTDSVIAVYSGSPILHRTGLTTYTGGTYTAGAGVSNCIVTFSDGAIGYFQSSDVFSTIGSRIFNSGSALKEYGQLFNLPFPLKIYGLYGWISPAANFDAVLYSSPLSGSPIAEKIVSLDANTIASASARKFVMMFGTPYTYTANADIVVAFKPGGSSVTAYYKTLANAAHRVADVWGTSGYGVSRATAAFANANSSLEHYYVGIIAGAFDAGGGGGGRAVQINATSLVA